MATTKLLEVIRPWLTAQQFGALVGDGDVTVPLRDETGVWYQISVYSHCFCWWFSVYVSEYTHGDGSVRLSKQRRWRAVRPRVLAVLDHARSIIGDWMREHGATTIQENSSPI
jgi:hypothetical protein